MEKNFAYQRDETNAERNDKVSDDILARIEDKNFREGLALVEIDDKYGFIDKKGILVIQPKYDKAFIFCNGLAIVVIDDKYGLIDKCGNFVVEPKLDHAYGFSEGLARVVINDKYGFIDKSGKLIIEPKFVYA